MVFLWKLDATKNCLNYGITIWCIKLTEFRPFDFHYSKAMVLNSYNCFNTRLKTFKDSFNPKHAYFKNQVCLLQTGMRCQLQCQPSFGDKIMYVLDIVASNELTVNQLLSDRLSYNQWQNYLRHFAVKGFSNIFKKRKLNKAFPPPSLPSNVVSPFELLVESNKHLSLLNGGGGVWIVLFYEVAAFEDKCMHVWNWTIHISTHTRMTLDSQSTNTAGTRPIHLLSTLDQYLETYMLVNSPYKTKDPGNLWSMGYQLLNSVWCATLSSKKSKFIVVYNMLHNNNVIYR